MTNEKIIQVKSGKVQQRFVRGNSLLEIIFRNSKKNRKIANARMTRNDLGTHKSKKVSP